MPVDDPKRDLELAQLHAQLVPLRSEVESYRVQAITWRDRAQAADAPAPAPRDETPWMRVLRRAKRAKRDRAAARIRAAGGVVFPEDFDAAHYRRRYADLAGLTDAELLAHYDDFGRHEGRRTRSTLGAVVLPPAPAPHPGGTVLFVTPSADDAPSTTHGMALVAELAQRHAVVTVVLQSRAKRSDAFAASAALVTLGDEVRLDEFEAADLTARLVERYAPRFAVLNTSRSRDFAAPLEARGVPSVVLVQEFAEDVSPRGELANLVATASQIVFPSAASRDSALREHAFLRGRTLPIVRPGRVPAPELPPVGSRGSSVDADRFVVVGAGPWTPRSGLDMFLQVATLLPATGRSPLFVWIGDELAGELAYADLVRAVARTGDLPARFRTVAPADARVWLDRADLFLATTRLEALPTIAAEAAARGIPVVAFDAASTLGEVLAEDDRTRPLVVPLLDVVSAAKIVDDLRTDPDAAQPLGAAAREVVAREFDIARTARQLEALAEESIAAAAQLPADAATIAAAGVFDPGFYWGLRGTRPDDDTVLRHYLHTSRLARPRARARSGLVARKGTPGFHPLVFVEHHPEADARDPLAEWIARGRPAGPWTHRVIDTVGEPPAVDPETSPVVAVHGHFFYPEALGDLLARLDRTTLHPRLVLTTDTDDKADALRRGLGGRPADILVVPNAGRDVGPLLTGVGLERLDGVDLLLHVHGKKSAHAGGGVGDAWRDFLFESLVAPLDTVGTAADAIVAAFRADPGLGLVFPEDANLNDWDENREIADALAPRLGITRPFPVHFDFPMGGMYWARLDAIRPLFELGLEWGDYPDEPLPVDGTLLHALERLGPFVAEARGYRYATAGRPGVSR